ncbi:MAG: hypothetical protein ABIQ56_07825, partial [Chitinophagaceae bacterium]
GTFITTQAQESMPDVASWPQAPQKAAKEMFNKYGKPDVSHDYVLAWIDKMPWAKIVVERLETKHSFPSSHTDMLEQSVMYKVPLEKLNELAKFDGSIKFDRTQGFLSARCDKEENNFLALNLAHDIITNKKTVEQARDAFTKIAAEKMNGGNPEYMQKLIFQPMMNAADPDGAK